MIQIENQNLISMYYWYYWYNLYVIRMLASHIIIL